MVDKKYFHLFISQIVGQFPMMQNADINVLHLQSM